MDSEESPTSKPNTLAKISKPLDAHNWETWRVEFEILMRNVRLDSIVLKEWFS